MTDTQTGLAASTARSPADAGAYGPDDPAPSCVPSEPRASARAESPASAPLRIAHRGVDSAPASTGQPVIPLEPPWPSVGRTSIILATYNERENIIDTIRGIFAHVPGEVEVIVVDDDSPDQTWKFAAQLEDPRVMVIRRVATRGLASAFNRGIIESRGDVVGWMDADTCMPPALLPKMIERLKDCDVVIGSRYAPGGVDDRHPLRVTASRLINGFARLVLGYGIGDYDSGFVVLRRSVFDKVSIIPTGYGAYFIEFIYTCCRKGLRVAEVPYRFTDRTKGVSKSAPSLIKFAWAGMGYVTRIIIARLRRFD